MIKQLTTTNARLASGVVFATLVLGSGVAMAGTANGTPVGNLTATQAPGPCNDLGANVDLGVTDGFISTPYSATGPAGSTPANFSTNASGAGNGVVGNVNPGTQSGKGTVTITVTATPGQSGKQYTGKVKVVIDCAPGSGK